MIIPAGDLIPFMTEIKDSPELAMDFLTNLTAVDYQDRFEVVYHLASVMHGYTLTVKVKLEDKKHPQVPSLCPLWKGPTGRSVRLTT